MASSAGTDNSRDQYYRADGQRRRSRSPTGCDDRHLGTRGARPSDDPYRRRVAHTARNEARESGTRLEPRTGADLIAAGSPLPAEDQPKKKPNYFPTGLLASAANTITQADGTTVTLKYHEPPEARKPLTRDQWRLFVFKDGDAPVTIDLNTRSCWLVGREATTADLEAAHPSVSKQHAAVQFRYIEKTDKYGDKIGRVRPYLIDLKSVNGTTLNNKPVPTSRFIELRDKDVIKFGHSSREYVLILAEA